MKQIMETGIIGLGKFGMQLGRVLTALGHVCVGLDVDPARVRQGRDALSRVYEADATDTEALAALKVHTLDNVVVAIGARLEASVLVILGLQELGVKKIIAKAASPVHKKVLQRLGVERIVQPEIDAATQLALKLDNPGLLDLLPIGRGVALQEAVVHRWAGKSLAQLDLRAERKILVAAVRRKDQQQYHFVPDPHRPLEAGDTLLLIGYRDGVSAAVERS